MCDDVSLSNKRKCGISVGTIGETTNTFTPLRTVCHLRNFEVVIIDCFCSLLALSKLTKKKSQSRVIYQHHPQVANLPFITEQKYTSDQLNKITLRVHRRNTHIHLSCIPMPQGPLFNCLTPILAFL